MSEFIADNASVIYPPESSRLFSAVRGFDERVLESLDKVAVRHRNSSLDNVLANQPQPEVVQIDGYRPQEVIDIIPKEYDRTLVYSLPMGNPLDGNMRTMLSVLSLLNPNTRIISASNPGRPSHRYGGVSLRDMHRVASGDLSPITDPIHVYLQQEGIEQSVQVGFSYGADKAATMTQTAHEFDHEVTNAIFIEPAAVAARSLIQLGLDFQRSGELVEAYADKANSRALNEALHKVRNEGLGVTGFALGLVRPSNLAITGALSKDGFASRVSDALDSQPSMKASIIWGSESEIAVPENMRAITKALTKEYGNSRVKGVELPGQRHAMANDIYLHGAIVSNYLRS